MSLNQTPSSAVDVNLHSRVICALGLSAVEHIVKTEVLFVGCPGAAVEAAKNLALSGVHRIMLCDPSPVTWRDMSENAFLDFSQAAGGSTTGGPFTNKSESRAAASVAALKALNPTTTIEVCDISFSDSSSMSETFIAFVKSQFNHCNGTGVVVFTNPETVLPKLVPNTPTPISSLLFSLTDALRALSIPCIVGLCYGAQMNLVADFGSATSCSNRNNGSLSHTFTIEDPTGDRGERGLVIGCEENNMSNDSAFTIKVLPPEADTIANFSTEFSLLWEGLQVKSSGNDSSSTCTVSAHIPILVSKAFQPKTPDEKLYVSLTIDTSQAQYVAKNKCDGDKTTNNNNDSVQFDNECSDALLSVLRDLCRRFMRGCIEEMTSHSPIYIRTTVKPITVEHISIREAFSRSVAEAVQGHSQHATAAVGFAAIRQLAAVPNRHNTAEVKTFLETSSAITQCDDTTSTTDIRNLLWFLATAQGGIASYAAVAGGYIAQEVMKFVSRQYRPINANIYYGNAGLVAAIPIGSKVDVLLQSAICSAKLETRNADEAHHQSELSFIGKKFRNTRYEGAAELLGGDRLELIQNSNVFVVGAGALGCEYLKNLAMLGVGVGPKGGITITDNDHIERSNLTRQFLFRDHHVGTSKAQTAASVVKSLINSKCKIRALTEKVCDETCRPSLGGIKDAVFDRRFWQRVSIVAIAVDNNKARAFLLEQCRRLGKPIINAGTLGPQGSIDAVVPFVTAIPHIAAGDEAGGTSKVPQCTLHFFPSTINHCIQFAVDAFAAVFKNPLQTAEKFVRSIDSPSSSGGRGSSLGPRTFQDVLSEWESNNLVDVTASSLHEVLVSNPIYNFEACVLAAVRLYHMWHVTNIDRLLERHPLEAIDPKTGTRFWSGAKVPPRTTPLSSNLFSGFEESATSSALYSTTPIAGNQRDFLVSAAMLYAAAFDVADAPVGTQSVIEHSVLSMAKRMYAGVMAESEVSEEQRRAQIAQNTLPSSAGGAPSNDNDDDAVRDRLAKEADERYKAKLAAMLADLGAFYNNADVDKAHYFATHLKPQEFEKDRDENYHVAFVTACSNARALCYGIPTETFLETKRIAGNILPALVTTTAVVTGLASMQLIQALAIPSLCVGHLQSAKFQGNSYFVDVRTVGEEKPLLQSIYSTNPTLMHRNERAKALAELFCCGGISVANAHNSSLFECDPEPMRPLLKVSLKSKTGDDELVNNNNNNKSQSQFTLSVSQWDVAEITLPDDCSLLFFVQDCLRLWLQKGIRKVILETSANDISEVAKAVEDAIARLVQPKSITDCATGSYTPIVPNTNVDNVSSTSAITLNASVGLRTRLGLLDLYREKYSENLGVEGGTEEKENITVESCDFYYVVDAATCTDEEDNAESMPETPLKANVTLSGPLPLFHLQVASR